MVLRLEKRVRLLVGLCFILCGALFLCYGLWRMQGQKGLWQQSVQAQPIEQRVDPSKPMVALTFDDGPYAPSTVRILEALETVQGRATFFVVGSRVAGREETLLKIQASGCEIGNHTFDHISLRGKSDVEVLRQLQNTDAAIFKVTGEKPTVVRPPGGAYSENIKKLTDCPIVAWTVDTMDWNHQNANITVQKVLKEVKDGDIVLMHDLFVPTAVAVERLLPELQKRGFQFVTVSELLAYRENVQGVISLKTK